MAALVTAGAYTLTALGRTADLPGDIGPFLGVVLVLLLAPHLANRVLARGADPTLLPLAALLNGIGYVFIARINPDLAAKQATWTIVGVGVYVTTLLMLRSTRDLARYKWTAAMVGLGMLLLPFVPGLGRTVNGSRLWIRAAGLSFQPGEIAKVALAIFFAGYLVERRELLAMATWKVGPVYLPEPRHLGPLVVAWLMSIGIMTMQKDLGSSLLFFALFVVMVWVATERLSYAVIGVVLFAVGAFFAWSQFAHVQTRVDIWIDPWADPLGKGYQIIQGIYAFAGGGITGTGLGLGDPTRIPEVQNDFIFAAVGEELGLFGATAILIAFMLMIGSALRIAIRSERHFDKLLAGGLATIIGIQAFIIIGGVLRVVPLTGVALPFVSYGGSSLLANYVLLAILMRISDTTAIRFGEVPQRKNATEPDQALMATTATPVVDA